MREANRSLCRFDWDTRLASESGLNGSPSQATIPLGGLQVLVSKGQWMCPDDEGKVAEEEAEPGFEC